MINIRTRLSNSSLWSNALVNDPMSYWMIKFLTAWSSPLLNLQTPLLNDQTLDAAIHFFTRWSMSLPLIKSLTKWSNALFNDQILWLRATLPHKGWPSLPQVLQQGHLANKAYYRLCIALDMWIRRLLNVSLKYKSFLALRWLLWTSTASACELDGTL